jgi:mannose-6-phosphate isomerase
VNGNAPIRLQPRFLEKIWGSTDLAPWYPRSETKIGEIWFESELPILVKFLFTSDRLSVQVHPDDSFAQKHETSCGKTEMWYVLRADPGAQLAIGLRESITSERLRDASLSGEIEDLLKWLDVQAGDVFLIPAGTVHAIGAGLALCEIQQSSDITYRLYDYGRPRELHLEKALRVASTRKRASGPLILPVDCEYFHVELAKATLRIEYKPEPDRFHLLIFLGGSGTIADQAFREGETWLVPAGARPFFIQPADPVKFLRAWVPRPSDEPLGPAGL